MTTSEKTSWSPSTDDWSHARAQLDRAVRGVVQAIHGDGAFEARPVFEGARTQQTYVKPTQGLRAAMMLCDLAERAMRDFVLQRRGEGASWDQLAEVLGMADAVAAFRFVAPDEPGSSHPATFSWRCKTCGTYVRDQGPYDAHPANAELGHADDCKRLAAEVEWYERDWQDERDWDSE